MVAVAVAVAVAALIPPAAAPFFSYASISSDSRRSEFQTSEKVSCPEAAFSPRTILGKPPLHGTRIAFQRLLFLEWSLEF